MNLFLIGFMGCGKSHALPILASAFSLESYDLDAFIEHSSQLSIATIFDEKGEDYFRQQEKNSLELLCSKQNIIVACGGGAPCFFNNIELMNNSGTTIWLDENEDVLFERLKNERHNRPLIKTSSDETLRFIIAEKLQQRKSFYNQAKIHIKQGDNLIEKIKSFLK